jgi:hypothetical protein
MHCLDIKNLSREALAALGDDAEKLLGEQVGGANVIWGRSSVLSGWLQPKLRRARKPNPSIVSTVRNGPGGALVPVGESSFESWGKS